MTLEALRVPIELNMSTDTSLLARTAWAELWLAKKKLSTLPIQIQPLE